MTHSEIVSLITKIQDRKNVLVERLRTTDNEVTKEALHGGIIELEIVLNDLHEILWLDSNK